MEKTGKVKVAVMGFENGHCMSIFKGMINCDACEVVAVSFAPGVRMWDREKRMGVDMHALGIDVYYDDEEMLKAHPEIEGCAITGSNKRHMEQFRLCAERGIHIISMKVPTLDMDEYDEMIRLQEKHHILVHTELEMRWRASIERLKDVINSGAIGEVESFTAYNYSHNPLWWFHWMDVPEESYGKRIPIRPGATVFRGGALTDHPHIFDVMTYVFGSDIESVYAECAPNMREGVQTEDMVYVTGRMKNGIIFSLDPSYANRERELPRSIGELDWIKYPKTVQVDIQVNGDKGSIIADVYGADNIETLQPDNVYMVTDYEVNLPLTSNKFIGDFVKSIRSPNSLPQVDFKAHKKVMLALNAAYDSIYTGEVIKIQYDEE